MENQSNHRVSNFWFGFLLGSAVAGSSAFFLGTKKGRKTLQKILELSENLEENIILIAEGLGDELKEKAKEIYEEVEKPGKKDFLTISSVLSKIKSLAPQSSSNKKRFFIKK